MKRGYTLIEVIAVMAINLILLTGVISVSKIYEKNLNRIMTNSIVNDVSNLISFSKYYCRYNNISGAIQANKNSGEIYFKDISGINEIIKKIDLPEGYTMSYSYDLQINNLGHVQSDSIIIKDRYGNVSKITISTGLDTVNVYIGED